MKTPVKIGDYLEDPTDGMVYKVIGDLELGTSFVESLIIDQGSYKGHQFKIGTKISINTDDKIPARNYLYCKHLKEILK